MFAVMVGEDAGNKGLEQRPALGHPPVLRLPVNHVIDAQAGVGITCDPLTQIDDDRRDKERRDRYPFYSNAIRGEL